MDDDDDDETQLEQQQQPQLPSQAPAIRYEETFAVASPPKHGLAPRALQGDKILLPPSALEALLNAAARARQLAANGSPYAGSASRRAPFRSLDSDAYEAGGGGGGADGRADAFDLPQPLTFRLTNAAAGKSVYAGIREFSADEGEVVLLGDYLRAALGLDGGDGGDGGDAAAEAAAPLHLSVAFHPLPKGTFVHLRPLAAGYNPGDWQPLLERQLREGYTTLTRGAVFTVRGGAAEAFRFRVDGFQPAGDGICVVDTDLEVDIEALDAEQALETMRQIQGTGRGGSDSDSGGGTAPAASSAGGTIDIWKPVAGHVRPGDYVDYELRSWDRARPLAIVLSGFDDGDDDANGEAGGDRGLAVDLLASPYSARHRVRPRETEHVWANFGVADGVADGASKTIVLQPTNADLEAADSLWIAVHGWQGPEASSAGQAPRAHKYTLRARIVLEEEGGSVLGGSGTQPAAAAAAAEAHGVDEEQCQNCFQWVPRRTMVLHESFCLRNNVPCPACKQVFQKRSAAWAGHWHCALDPDDGGRGSSAASKTKHDLIFHPGYVSADRLYSCPADTCVGLVPPFTSLPDLARHRTTTCPAKLILCQFCQLEVPQEGDPTDRSVDAATRLTGQTPHERADGARTTDCYLCGAIVRMRDMRAHLQHHDLDRQNRVPPDICRDALCGRTRFGVGPRGQIKGPPATAVPGGGSNSLGLCAVCFAPLYVSTHDPEGKAMRRRVERRYLSQLLTGCGRAWCANPWCKTGRTNQGLEPLGAGANGGTAVLLPLVKPLVAEALSEPAKPVHFCVDEESQKRRAVAELLVGQGGGAYELAWCVAACEAEGADAGKAWEWLTNWAPQRRA